jgi:sigma-B regulation protein RsbU (phosphoserine phosphatase)
MLATLDPTGPAIGLMKEAKYRSKSLSVSANDLLVLYTDGLVEGRNELGEEFGEEKLLGYIRENHHKSAAEFLAGIQEYSESFIKKFHDDLTLVVIKL